MPVTESSLGLVGTSFGRFRVNPIALAACGVAILLGVPVMTEAGTPFRLTLDGELQITPFSQNPFNFAPPLEEALGLENGDPFQLIFDFDSTIVPPSDELLAIERFEARIGANSFVLDPARILSARVSQAGDSGIRFSSNLFGFIPEATQSDLVFGLFSTVTFLFDFETGDIGADPSRFPVGLLASDITDYFSGTFQLFDLGGDPDSLSSQTGVLRLALTGLSVSVVPEPVGALLLLTAVGVIASRRRR